MRDHAEGALRCEPGGIETGHASGHVPDPREPLALEDAGGQAGAMAGAADQGDVMILIQLGVTSPQHRSRNVERT